MVHGSQLLKGIEYGFGFTIMRSPYAPNSIYSRETILIHNSSSRHCLFPCSPQHLPRRPCVTLTDNSSKNSSNSHSNNRNNSNNSDNINDRGSSDEHSNNAYSELERLEYVAHIPDIVGSHAMGGPFNSSHSAVLHFWNAQGYFCNLEPLKKHAGAQVSNRDTKRRSMISEIPTKLLLARSLWDPYWSYIGVM